MLVTRDRLDELIDGATEPCVSIVMPTVVAGPETRQNPIRFKNLLTDAEKRLEMDEADEGRADEVLEHGRRLLDDYSFWQHQAKGLAVYLTPEGVTRFRLPLDVDEKAVVDSRPYIKPLLPLLTGDGRYHVLAFSQKKIRFFEGSRESLRELEVPNMPTSLEDAVGRDTEQQALQYHSTGAPSGTDSPSPIFHGHGGGEDDQLAELRQLVHRVDEAVRSFLGDSQAPLVLAAVERQAAEYRDLTHYQHLADGFVAGNPDEASAQELHDKTWQHVEPHFDSGRNEAKLELENHLGTEDRVVIDDVTCVLRDASFGRVQTLFLARDAEAWGAWNAETSEADLHERREPGDHDLYEEAALQGLRHGSAVYVVDRLDMPHGAESVAALLRY